MSRPSETTLDPLRVLIVSTDVLSREGLSTVLAREPGLQEAGRCAPEAARRAAASARADVVLWDARDERATDLLDDVAAPVLALYAGPPALAELLAAGAAGCVSRESDSGRLADALRAVASGLHVLDAEAGRTVLPRAHPEMDGPAEPLTPREQEVLGLLSLGLTNRAIAGRLAISEHTAKFHVNAVMSKLGVDSRTEAVVKAARLGLVVL